MIFFCVFRSRNLILDWKTWSVKRLLSCHSRRERVWEKTLRRGRRRHKRSYNNNFWKKAKKRDKKSRDEEGREETRSTAKRRGGGEVKFGRRRTWLKESLHQDLVWKERKSPFLFFPSFPPRDHLMFAELLFLTIIIVSLSSWLSFVFGKRTKKKKKKEDEMRDTKRLTQSQRLAWEK